MGLEQALPRLDPVLPGDLGVVLGERPDVGVQLGHPPTPVGQLELGPRGWPCAGVSARGASAVYDGPQRQAARRDGVTGQAEIGVFGGSGFYSLLDDVREIKVDTPYGPPSDSLFLADVGGRRVAFLPRHGRRHTIPPHKINFRANVWAMSSLGRARRSSARAPPAACRSASRPGDFVVCDQFVDRTSGRPDTFFDGPIVSHVSSADIYDPELRRIAVEVIREHDIPVHDGGTVVVIQGPRFSTKSESKWFSDAGWEVINMTQYPEAYLCRELGMAVVNISLITDYDAGVHEGTEAVNAMSVLEVFELNAARIQKVVLEMIRRFPADLDALGAGDMLAFTRGDGHTVSPEDIRLFETGSVSGRADRS